MQYDESLEPERIERQAKEFAEVQANLKPLSREQWDEIQELRPRTPFESKIGRSHARIRSGEPMSLVSCPLLSLQNPWPNSACMLIGFEPLVATVV